MARTGRDAEIVPSLLDRLIDDNPNLSHDSIQYRVQNVHELKSAVARDLENMLNTRREALAELPVEFAEVNKSLIVYGLPDFTAYNMLNSTELAKLKRAIEATIEIFEPRLRRVRVTMEPYTQSDHVVRFRIEALLHVDPAPELVAFETFLQLGTQKYLVQEQE